MPDLYVVNYLNESADNPRLCPNPASPDGFEGCSPALFDGVHDRLFLSTGFWQANDATELSGLSNYSGKGLGVAIVDLNEDLVPEVYVANDGEANYLFVNRLSDADMQKEELVGVTLNDRAVAANIALNEVGYAQAGMGIAVGDHDRNGTSDLFLTHFYGDTNTLYSNREGLLFEDTTRRSRLGPASRAFLGFGVSFIDAANDGWQDLVVANGHVDDREWMPGGQPYRMLPQFFRNEGDGTFLDVSSRCGNYFEKTWIGRGLATVDFNHDGKQDFAVSHQLDNSVALINRTESDNQFLSLRFVGKASDRNGVGVSVTVSGVKPVLRRQLFGGGSFQSASSQRMHFGLAQHKRVELMVRWPSGETEVIEDVSPGRYVIVQGSSRIRAEP